MRLQHDGTQKAAVSVLRHHAVLPSSFKIMVKYSRHHRTAVRQKHLGYCAGAHQCRTPFITSTTTTTVCQLCAKPVQGLDCATLHSRPCLQHHSSTSRNKPYRRPSSVGRHMHSSRRYKETTVEPRVRKACCPRYCAGATVCSASFSAVYLHCILHISHACYIDLCFCYVCAAVNATARNLQNTRAAEAKVNVACAWCNAPSGACQECNVTTPGPFLRVHCICIGSVCVRQCTHLQMRCTPG